MPAATQDLLPHRDSGPQADPDTAAAVTAASGYDAISHAIETLFSTRRTPISECFSREAWRLLDSSFERVRSRPEDLEARSAMLLGAHFAGLAVEYAMLGPAHACAQPLTARYGLAHGAALALVLPHVIEWTAADEDVMLPPDISACPISTCPVTCASSRNAPGSPQR